MWARRASRSSRLVAVLAALLMVTAGVGTAAAETTGDVQAPPVAGDSNASWAPWKACADGSTHNCAVVRTILPVPSGEVYIGGDFSELRNSSGQSFSASNLVRLDPDGNPSPTFQTHSFNGMVLSVVSTDDGIVAAGTFTQVDGSWAGRLARFDLTGKREPFQSNVIGSVHAAVHHQGRLLLGGDFSSIQGTPRVGLAAVDARTGALDPSWAPTAALIENDARPNDKPHNNVAVRDLEVHATPAGARLFVTGDFDLINGVARPALAALDATSTALLNDFDATAALGGQQAKNVQGFQIALVTGSTGALNGLVLAGGGLSNRSFRLNAAGGLVYAINADGDVQAAAYSDGVVYLGGHFALICTLSCYDTNTDDDFPRMHVAAFMDGPRKPSPDPSWAPSLGPIFSPYYYGVWTLESRNGAVFAGGVFRDVKIGGETAGLGKFASFPLRSTEALAAPGLPVVQAGGQTTALQVSWPAVDGASGYEVRRYSELRGFERIATTTTPGFSDTGLLPARQYDYAVVALSGSDRSAPSSAGTGHTAPETPGSLTVAASSADPLTADAQWTQVNGATGYELERTGGAGSPVIRTVGATPGAQDPGLAPQTSYTYRVRSTGAGGPGPWSGSVSLTTPATAPPGVPQQLAATTVPGDAGALDVGWLAGDGQRADDYVVQDVTAGRPPVELGVVQAPTTALRVTGLRPETRYDLTVVARNTAGASTAATPVTVTTPAISRLAPPATTSATLVTESPDRLAVSWSAVQGATGYEVERTVSGGQPVLLTSTGTALADQGLSAGTLVSYRVRAVGGGSSSDFGAAAAARTVPAAPGSVTATPGDARATVAWVAPEDAGASISGYRVRAYNGTALAATVQAPATATSTVVTGLVNGKAYRFDVAAVVTGGHGGVSALTAAVTPARPPSAPVIGTATSGTTGGDITATATWSPPTRIGMYPVEGYEVTALRMSASGSVLSRTVSGPLTPTARSLTMLLPRTGSYRFTVVAWSQIGRSPASARSNLVQGQ